ncbi:hypothetical protein [Pseudomonas sp. B26(2017)]|uniref:hypothetical protein n=1 Tax=Pseudomonas sp. B26(2017) TaxID=1981732 RepID=UPI002114EE95|nr:hypothetical protein [Pseudomonas sp. B26(2017)]
MPKTLAVVACFAGDCQAFLPLACWPGAIFGRHYQACGKWVIGGRDNQNVIALNVTSSDGGNNLGGSHTCANEGPIGFRGQME